MVWPSHRACVKCLRKIPWYGLKPSSKRGENETLIKWGWKCLVIKWMNFYGSQIALPFWELGSQWVLNLSIVSFNCFFQPFSIYLPIFKCGLWWTTSIHLFKEMNHMLMTANLVQIKWLLTYWKVFENH